MRSRRLLTNALEIPVTEQQVVDWLEYGREEGRSDVWVIDPLDGTRGFLNQRSYVIAAGLMTNRVPMAAVIGAPTYPDATGILCCASGNTATAESSTQSELPQRIQVSTRTAPSLWRCLESPANDPHSQMLAANLYRLIGIRTQQVQQIDGQEKHTRLALGDAEVVLRLPRPENTRPYMLWDYVAGITLIWAAGGQVTDVDGSPIDFSSGSTLKNRGIIASNGLIHDHLLRTLAQVLQTK